MNQEAERLYANEEERGLTQKEFDKLFPQDQWIEIAGKVESKDDVTGQKSSDLLVLRPELVGQYDVNNSTIAVVGPNGRLRVAPLTHARWEAVKKGGLRYGGFGVPFSSGSSPSEESFSKRWADERAAASKDLKEHGPVPVDLK